MSDKFLTLEEITKLAELMAKGFPAPNIQSHTVALGFAILDILADVTAGMKLGADTRFGAADEKEEKILLSTPWIRTADEND